MARHQRSAEKRRQRLCSAIEGIGAGLIQGLVPLERRELLAAINVTNGVLSIDGDASATTISVALDKTTQTITASAGKNIQSFPLSSVQQIKISGSATAATITVSPALTIPPSIHGNGGNDTIVSGAGNDHVYGETGNDNINA